MKSATALCCLAGLLSVGICSAASNGPNPEIIFGHVVGIISDGVSLSSQNNNNQEEVAIQTGVSILGHLGSIFAHLAQSRRDAAAKPLSADELAVLLMNDNKLAQQIGTALAALIKEVKAQETDKTEETPAPTSSNATESQKTDL